MHLDIVTPSENIFSGEIKLIQLPGSNGSFELLENHAPIVSTLNKGIIRIITKDGRDKTFEIGGGVLEAAENKVTALVESV